VVLQALVGDLVHEQDGDDVQPGHQAHTEVTQIPGEGSGVHGAVDGGDDDAELQQQGEDGALHLAVDVGNVGFGDVVVRQDGGESEAEQGDGDDGGAEAGHPVLHCSLHVTRTCGDAGDTGKQCTAISCLHVVLTGDQQHEGGGGADEQGVDVNREALNQALLGRVADGCGGRRVRAGTLASFVGVNATRDAPLDSHADNGAEAGLEAEGALDDQHHDFRQFADVQQDDHQRYHDVAQRHERHDHLGEM